jgi:predicted dehydrogenase
VTSLLLQKGAHDLDVIHWLAGGYTRRVTGLGDLAVYGDITSRRDNSDRTLWDWYSADNWPPTAQTDPNPVIDVEDISMLQMRLDNGVLASYQQCHFTPDYWRNYTVIGDAGRLENVGDDGGDVIHVWTSRHSSARHPEREGGATDTSPVAAREAVAAGCAGADSLRTGSAPVDVAPLDPDLVAHFEVGTTEAGPPSRAGV